MQMLGEFFDPKSDLVIESRLRPHWSQSGAVVFITFRTIDSIPREVLDRWEREKNQWVRLRGHVEHWSKVLPKLDQTLRDQFHQTFSRHREVYLDECHGKCVLRSPMLSKIVEDSLLYFDGHRYCMGDFVIMPNHVHLLAAFPNQEGMRAQCESWTHFTAVQIHRKLGEKGTFWQSEPFDHLVRSLDQYEYLRRYIAENPLKAKLKSGEYRYRRYEEDNVARRSRDVSATSASTTSAKSTSQDR
jgi:putative transposase